MSPLGLFFPTVGVIMDRAEDAGCGFCSLGRDLTAMRE